MIKTYISLERGEKLPKWYYGLTRYDFDKQIYFFDIMPINYIKRLFYFLEYKFNRFRTTPSYVDMQIRKIEQKHNIKLLQYKMELEKLQTKIHNIEAVFKL